uniref:E3 ubiquitin-protein ligase COP1-like isoform X2 n=1 Tax=Tanacetum cinerariifolium TaxID=118510 RepID=A0A6L2JEJ0_TANCI|nr:E3 ubiquitin-protein ligase COP1-like isoform X2 [Tanacetum cinerariifolium]
MTTPIITSTTDSQLHNNIIVAGSRDRPPMHAMRRYAQWRSCFLRYIDTRPNGDALRKCILEGPYTLSTVVEAIERLQQGESLNIQDVKTNLFWEFGKFTSHDGETMKSYYTRLYKLVNEMIRNNLTVATIIARNANPLALVSTAQPNQDPYYQTPKSHKSYAPTSKASLPTRSHETTRNKGKDMAKSIIPPSESASKEDNDHEQAQRDKDMNMNDNQTGQFRNQRTVNVAGARENVGSPIVQQTRIQCFNCKEFDTDEEIDEQELEAHYSYMEKIQEVPTADSCTDSEPLEQVQYDAGYNVSANEIQHFEQSESISNTCVVERDDSNVILDSPDMCDNVIQNDQNAEECDDEPQLQEKNISINELKKLIEKCNRKSVGTKFDKPSVVRQPNAQRIPKPSVLGKPAPFSDSLERKHFLKTKPVPKTNVLEGLSKPVTTQNMPQTATQAVRDTNVIKPGMYRIDSRITQTRAPKFPQTYRNNSPCVSTSTGVTHKTNVSRPKLRSTQMKDNVMPNNSQVKDKKTEVEDHLRISSIYNNTKSVTMCNDSLKSRTSNVDAVCATCGKCLVDSYHFACVTKLLCILVLENPKGAVRFRKREKLSPRYIRPFKIIARVGTVAYTLDLPKELKGIHSTFHVSNVKKCLAKDDVVVQIDEIQLDDKLHMIEEPVEVLDREVKRLNQSRIPIAKDEARKSGLDELSAETSLPKGGENVTTRVSDHGFVGYPFDCRVTMGFGSIAGGIDHVNPVTRLPLEHEISRFNDLQQCYLQKQCHLVNPIDNNDKKDVDVVQREGYSSGLSDFKSVLSTFTQYSRLWVIAELRHGKLYHSDNIISSIEFDRDDEMFATAGVLRRINFFNFSTSVMEYKEHEKQLLVIILRKMYVKICECPCSSWKFIDSSTYEGLLVISAPLVISYVNAAIDTTAIGFKRRTAPTNDPINIPKPPQNVISSLSVLANSPAFVRPSRTPTFARFDSTLNIKTLVAAAEPKAKEFTEVLKKEYYPWCAQYMVIKRLYMLMLCCYKLAIWQLLIVVLSQNQEANG